MAYRRYRKVETRIARIFKHVRPRMRLDDGRVVPTFVAQALRGEPLTVLGTAARRAPSATWTTWSRPLAAAPLPGGRPVNLGKPERDDHPRLRGGGAAPVGSRCAIEHRPLPEDDPRVRQPTSPARARCSAGSPGSSSRKGCAGPWPGSGSGSRAGRDGGGHGEADPHHGRGGVHRLDGGGTSSSPRVGRRGGRRPLLGPARERPPGARFYPCDVRSAAAAEVVLRERPEVLCHHAAQIDVRRSMADPRHDADVNVGGLLNLMEAAVRAGSVEQVLFASSGGALYGDTDRMPTREDHPMRPVSHYGPPRRRASSTSGSTAPGTAPGGRPSATRTSTGRARTPRRGRVVAIFCGGSWRAAVHRERDGGQTRDYVFVADVPGPTCLAAGTAARRRAERRHRRRRPRETPCTRTSPGRPASPPGRAGTGAPRRAAPSCLDPSGCGRALGWRPEVALAGGSPGRWSGSGGGATSTHPRPAERGRGLG